VGQKGKSAPMDGGRGAAATPVGGRGSCDVMRERRRRVHIVARVGFFSIKELLFPNLLIATIDFIFSHATHP